METLFILGICGILLCILFSLFALMAYSGLFHNIQVSTGKPPIGEIIVAYKFARGPYKDAGQIFSEVVRLAPYKKNIGIYYDDPKQVPSDKTRYIVGAILSEDGAEPDEELQSSMKAKGYVVTHFPEVSHAVKTQFPFKCTLSIFIALVRVYPQLGRYLKERRLCAHPILEIYDDYNIHFIAPLAKQNEFYVAEAQSTPEEQASDGDDSITTTETSMSNSSYTASEQSHRSSVSAFSNAPSDLSTTTTVTADFNESSSREMTDSSKSVSREKSVTPAEELTPLLVKPQLSPVSVDDDQEWENLEVFRTQDDAEEKEELVASVSSIQDTAAAAAAATTASLTTNVASLVGNLHESSPSKDGDVAAPAEADATVLQDSISSSHLEESGFSESVLSTLQDSGLGSEETGSPQPHIIAAATAANLATNDSSTTSLTPEQQQQQPQLAELESDTASEHSSGSSSYEEVKLTEVVDA